jgi:hypothetical protein
MFFYPYLDYLGFLSSLLLAVFVNYSFQNTLELLVLLCNYVLLIFYSVGPMVWFTDSDGDGNGTHIIAPFLASQVRNTSGRAAVRWSWCQAISGQPLHPV